MRYTFLMNFILLSSLHIFAQNDSIKKVEFEKTFEIKIPTISVQSLHSSKDVLYFKIHDRSKKPYGEYDGIALQGLYDNWNKVRFIEGYEEYGLIQEIRKFKKITCVFLSKATLIIHPDSSVKIIDIIAPDLTFSNNKIYFISFLKYRYNRLPVRSFSAKKTIDDHLYIYDLEKKDLQKNPIDSFPTQVSKIESLEFWNNQLWFIGKSFPSDISTFFWLFRMTDEGEIISRKERIAGLQPIRFLKKVNDNLVLVCNEGIFEMNKKRNFEKLYSIDVLHEPLEVYSRDNFLFWTYSKSSNFWTRILDLKSSTILEDVSPKDGFYSKIQKSGNNIYQYNPRENIISKKEINEDSEVLYSPVGGILPFNYIVTREDEKEVWFLSYFSNYVYKLIKNQSKLITYSRFDNNTKEGGFAKLNNFRLNPLKDFFSDLRMNDKYVFITRASEKSLYSDILVFNRIEERFSFFTRKKFFDFFIKNNTNIPFDLNEASFLKEDELLDNSLDFSDNYWIKFMALLDLSFSGNFFGVIGLKLKTEENVFISLMEEGKQVVYKINRISNNISKLTIPTTIPYIKYGKYPFLIVGDNEKIWLSGYGDDAKGFILINLKSGKITTNKEWFQKISNIGNMELINGNLHILEFRKKKGNKYALHILDNETSQLNTNLISFDFLEKNRQFNGGKFKFNFDLISKFIFFNEVEIDDLIEKSSDFKSPILFKIEKQLYLRDLNNFYKIILN